VESARALSKLQLAEATKARLDLLAQKANEGQLTAEQSREYDRFVELGDIIAALCLNAQRQLKTTPG